MSLFKSPSLARWVKAVRAWHRSGTGGGAREVARRRRQIERGQLTGSNGLIIVRRDR